MSLWALYYIWLYSLSFTRSLEFSKYLKMPHWYLTKSPKFTNFYLLISSCTNNNSFSLSSPSGWLLLCFFVCLVFSLLCHRWHIKRCTAYAADNWVSVRHSKCLHAKSILPRIHPISMNQCKSIKHWSPEDPIMMLKENISIQFSAPLFLLLSYSLSISLSLSLLVSLSLPPPPPPPITFNTPAVKCVTPSPTKFTKATGRLLWVSARLFTMRSRSWKRSWFWCISIVVLCTEPEWNHSLGLISNNAGTGPGSHLWESPTGSP